MISARGFVAMTLLAGIVVTLGLLKLMHIGVSFKALDTEIPIMIGTSLLCGQVYRSRGIAWLDRTVACVECIGLLVLATYVGAFATYPLAALSSGWYDDYMVAADATLRLDWPTYWSFVKAHAVLNVALDLGYRSIVVTPTVVLIALCAIGRIDRAYQFVAAYISALAVTDFILMLLPAKSAAVHFLGMESHNLPIAGVAHIAVIEQLRTSMGYLIPADRIAGLIAFPSFHASAGLLFAWAAWPVRWLRWPCLIVNMLLFLATPIQGGHYFVEVIAGLMVAILAIAVVRILTGRAGSDMPTRSGIRRLPRNPSPPVLAH